MKTMISNKRIEPYLTALKSGLRALFFLRFQPEAMMLFVSNNTYIATNSYVQLKNQLFFYHKRIYYPH